MMLLVPWATAAGQGVGSFLPGTFSETDRSYHCRAVAAAVEVSESTVNNFC